jgi:IS5 family transposase
MINPETSIPGLTPLFKTEKLADALDQKHPLIILGKAINWDDLVGKLIKFYSQFKGRTALSIRLLVSLLLLKYIYDRSDVEVVAQWKENVYYQAFSGRVAYQIKGPCSPSSLTRFRKRIGKAGAEIIFQESVRIHGPGALEKECVADTTVQESNITFPTDSKLILRAIRIIMSIAAFLGIRFKRTHSTTIAKLKEKINFGRKSMEKDDKQKAVDKLRVIANSLLEGLIQRLPSGLLNRSNFQMWHLISKLRKAINQTRNDEHKIYSIHKDGVNCIAKGKAHKKYEFGSKVSLILSKSGSIILGAVNFIHNAYDGDTLNASIEQMQRLHGHKPDTIVGDRGYKGREKVRGVKIVNPYDLQKTEKGCGLYRKLKNLLRRRTSIEPVIGHLKSDHRLCRNFLKGVVGDSINLLLSAAAFNYLKYSRIEYAHLIRPPKSLAKRLPPVRNKYYGLPIYKSNNSLF